MLIIPGNSFMRKVHPFLMIFLFIPFSISCERKEVNSCNKIEDSLVYIRGEKKDGEAALNASTGFVIAKKELVQNKIKYNKYYALTVNHGLKNQNNTVFVGVPFKLRKTITPKAGYLEKVNLFVANNENQFKIESIMPIGQLDASIISFTTEIEIPAACISLNKTDLQNKKSFQTQGFVTCDLTISNNSDYGNKYYFMHKKSGALLSDNDLDEKIKKGSSNERFFFMEMKNKEEKWKNDFNIKGIDIRHQIRAKIGMSGSPIFTENQHVVAMHSKGYYEPDTEIDNCTIDPQSEHGYGISMEKILSIKFPDDIRSHMNIQK
jgi:hypothetical protein